VTTLRDNQAEIAIDLVEGDDGARPIARYRLSDLPEAPAGEVLVLVDVTVDGDGLVGLQARPLGAGPRPKLRREAASGLSRAALGRGHA
jgi:molecular chaperone DnaK (HSP70)